MELAKDVSLTTLRATLSFRGISGKVKVYRTKILNHNKKMELLNAKKLAKQNLRKKGALGQSVGKMPGEATQARHRLWENTWSTHKKCS